MRRLPPLNALRVLEVAARTGSYAEAAIELGVTHGAVSRQIALLEGWLKQTLFTRQGRRMVATPAARIFAAEIALSFDRLATAAEACGRPGAKRILRVSAPTSFAMRWLIPRLDRFHRDHPHVEVVVTTVSTLLEELRGGVDVAIRRGTARSGSWPLHRVVPVLAEADTLIVSPALFARRPILKPADIARHILLSSETRAGDWFAWMEAAGLRPVANQRRLVFDHFFVTCRAVEDGIGVGIGPLPMLAADLAAGRLMAPLPQIAVPRTGYVALLPREADPDGLQASFVDWLAGEAPPQPAGDEPDRTPAAP